MSEKEIDFFKIAGDFLKSQGIGFVDSGSIGRKENNQVEVIFPVPETLDPSIAIVDPPDVRVWVSKENLDCELIYQM